MKIFLVSALALGAMASMALAGQDTPADTGSVAPAGLTNAPAAQAATAERTGPVDLTDAQMDKVSAGIGPPSPLIGPPSFARGIVCRLTGHQLGGPFFDFCGI